MKALITTAVLVLSPMIAQAQSRSITPNTVANPGLDKRAEYWQVTPKATIDSSSVTLEGPDSYIQQLAVILPHTPLQTSAVVSLSSTLDGKADCPTATFIVGTWEQGGGQRVIYKVKTENPKYEKNSAGKILSTTCSAPKKKYDVLTLNNQPAPAIRQVYVQKSSGSADVKVHSISLQLLDIPFPI